MSIGKRLLPAKNKSEDKFSSGPYYTVNDVGMIYWQYCFGILEFIKMNPGIRFNIDELNNQSSHRFAEIETIYKTQPSFRIRFEYDLNDQITLRKVSQQVNEN